MTRTLPLKAEEAQSSCAGRGWSDRRQQASQHQAAPPLHREGAKAGRTPPPRYRTWAPPASSTSPPAARVSGVKRPSRCHSAARAAAPSGKSSEGQRPASSAVVNTSCWQGGMDPGERCFVHATARTVPPSLQQFRCFMTSRRRVPLALLVVSSHTTFSTPPPPLTPAAPPPLAATRVRAGR